MEKKSEARRDIEDAGRDAKMGLEDAARDAKRGLEDAGDKMKAGMNAAKNKMEDTNRDVDLEYQKEKAKEKLK